MIAGTLFGALMAIWLLTPLVAAAANPGGMPWEAAPYLLLAMLALRGLRWAYRLVATGWTLLRHRSFCQIIIHGNQLRCVERMDGWRTDWHRQLPFGTDQITHLRIRPARMNESRTPTSKMDEWFGDHSLMLTAEAPGKKPFNLAIAFPADALVQLANAMKFYLPHTKIIDDTQSRPTGSQAGSEWHDRFVAPTTLPPQPERTDITLSTNPDSLTAQVPAAGLWRGAKGLLLFAAIWNGGVVAAMIGLFIAAHHGILDIAFCLASGVVLFVFELIGIGTIVAALDMAKRKTALAIASGQLFVVRQHLWGKKTQTWEVDRVDKIGVGPSGTKINDVPVRELQIHFDQGNVGFLSERSDEELDWLAAHLNHFLAQSMTDVNLTA